MKVIRPTTMTPAMLVSTNADESYDEWSAVVSYSKGDRVIQSTVIYESLINSNLNKPPISNPIEWLAIGPDNAWAMFDNQISTQTTRSGDLIVTVATGIIDSVYLGNLFGQSAKITVRDGLDGPVIYESSQSLLGDVVADWYQYFFFDPLLLKNQAIFRGIPPYGSSHLTIEIKGGSTAVGIASFGRATQIGSTSSGATSGIVSYSRKDTDEFGVTKFVKRPSSKRVSANVLVMNSQVNRVHRMITELDAVPVVWIAGNDAPEFDEPMIVFGFYRDFSAVVETHPASFYSLEIEGLI